MAGIYIHIPFCKQACHYCDFHFSTNQQLRPKLVTAIASEIVLQKEYLKGEVVKTIYFGGGTPSLLTQDEILLILNTLRLTFNVSDRAEITLEANPDDLNADNLNTLRQAGINRLSIGIQSFHDTILKFLNRVHNAASAIKTFHEAREAGFQNISIDLIYAIPGESDEQWRNDIDQAIALNPEHISCYALTIEEKTAFGKWAASGKLKTTEDEVAARHLEILMDMLGNAGYDHYEISNFARPGLHSKHNSNYWQREKYLGVGPSAHSYNGLSRQYTINNNSLYVKSVQSNIIPFEIETLSVKDKINEYILTSLRTSWGTNLGLLKNDYGHDLLKESDVYLSQLLKRDFVSIQGNVLTLTKKGKLLADKISSDLFVL